MLPENNKIFKPSLKIAALLPLIFVVFLWLIKFLETITGLHLQTLGVYPLVAKGLPGIAFSPLIHGSFGHLVSNTLPTFLMGAGLIYTYPRAARRVLPYLYILPGVGIWLFARPAWHIGASGLTYGLMFFIFAMGVLRKENQSIVLSVCIFFLYGSMIWGVFPGEPGVSFEAHFFGALCGVISAFFLKDLDPLPPEKKYDWQDEPDDYEDPLIGDEWRNK